MRPGQQNKRSRGRSNGGGGGGSNGNNNNFNRKGGNPLTRSYDSSGPDVKIRGTAQHIAEKYMTLARDAQSSGDRVMAENYLQHAEHYNRIIASAQAQMQERVQRDDRDYNDRDTLDVDTENDNDAEGDDQDVILDRSTHHAQPDGQPRSQRPQHQQRSHQQRPQHQPRPQPQIQPQPLPAEVEIAGSGPQPIIENTPVEATVAAEEVAQQAEAGKKERTARPRRAAAARPRRPRRTESGEGAAEASDDAGLETVTSE